MAASLVLALALAVAAPPAPTVTGPRDTTATRPVYVFRARGAVGFRCAFDSTRLHRCVARYSQPLTVGRHILRVRAVGRGGRLSRTTTVTIVVRAPVPALTVSPPVEVGPGAGVPAPSPSAVWVPTTSDGMLVRVSNGAVVSRTPFGVPGLGGDLDAAVAVDGAIWVASDRGARIARVDAASGAVTQTVPVAERPGGLVAAAGAVWAFHFLQGTITRVDAATGAATRLQGPNVQATGIAYGFLDAGSPWLLSSSPAELVELDPLTGAVRRTIALRPPFPPKRTFIETWSLAYADDTLWAALPNHDAVVRVDARTGAVQYVRLTYGRPFGVAVGGGSAWVATDRAVVRLDPATSAVLGASALPLADRSGFVSIAYGYGAAWVTNYDRGTLVQVTP